MVIDCVTKLSNYGLNIVTQIYVELYFVEYVFNILFY